MENKKQILSMQLNVDDFAPASDSEKESLSVMRESVSFWKDGLRRLRKNPIAMVSLAVLIIVLILAFIVPAFYPYDYATQIRGSENLGPMQYSEAEQAAMAAGEKVFPHILGTDSLGRDYAVRVMMGTRVSLSVGLLASVLVLLIGSVYGSVAGFLGGKVDLFMMRIVDIIYTVPDLLIIILLASTLKYPLQSLAEKPGFGWINIIGVPLISILIVFALLYWVGMARIVRSQVLTLKESEYVTAARALGAGTGRIIKKHILTNCIGTLIVTTTLQIPSAIFTESFLSFIGLGVQAPMPSLGSLANAARGGIVDETALAAALERGVIRGAAIDNFESEIPSPGNPLLRLSPEARRRVLFSPHLAGVTRAAFARLIRQAIGNLENSLRGLPPQFSVNGLSSIRPSA